MTRGRAARSGVRRRDRRVVGFGGKTVFSTRVTLFESELSDGGWASEADVLRWFERNRTDAIGGPTRSRGSRRNRASPSSSPRCQTRGSCRPLAGAVGSVRKRFGSDGDEEAATPTPTRLRRPRACARRGASWRRRGSGRRRRSAAEPQVVFSQALGGGGRGRRAAAAAVDDRGVRGGDARAVADTGRPVPCPPALAEVRGDEEGWRERARGRRRRMVNITAE